MLIAVLSLLLYACTTHSQEMSSDDSASDAVKALLWVENADPNRDAERAIDAGDHRLYVPAGRGQSVPGFSVTESIKYRRDCGTKLLPGTTDVVRGERHLQLLQAVHNYAEDYNRIVIKYCEGN